METIGSGRHTRSIQPACAAFRAGPVDRRFGRHCAHSQIFRVKSRVPGDARKHAWADFFIVVKRKRSVERAFARQGAMRPALALDSPADAKKSSHKPVRPAVLALRRSSVRPLQVHTHCESPWVGLKGTTTSIVRQADHDARHTLLRSAARGLMRVRGEAKLGLAFCLGSG